MNKTLLHFSDQPDTARFEPRLAPKLGKEVVWGLAPAQRYAYLVPRDCPRVIMRVGPNTDPADVARLMCGTTARVVVAIESRWLPTMQNETLYEYEFPAETFTLHDRIAGYYISEEPVTPLRVTPIPDLLQALLEEDVEFRILPSLWKLREEVIASTLDFSINRMRNAVPPPEGLGNYTPLP